MLDAGCGGGGMPLSLAEEADFVVGIDPADRFQDAGVRLGRERNQGNLTFALADGMYLPFRDRTFDMVLSHAVIEHVADAPLYLRECARVLAPGGHVFLSTAPYLSFAGAHLPRLKVQVPLHLMIGRRAAFGTFRFLARHAAWTLKEPAHENSFIRAARRGEVKHDDLLEKVRVSRLQAANRRRRAARSSAKNCTSRRPSGGCPRPWADGCATAPLTQDALISNMEYVLARGPGHE